MDFNKTLIACLLTVVTNLSFGQDSLCSRYCSFRSGQPLDSPLIVLIKTEQLDRDTATVQRAIEKILCIVVQDARYYKTKEYNEYNACAVECNKVKYILYNSNYLLEASRDNPYVMFGILGHEIGHHVLGSAWIQKNVDITVLYEAEFAADEFAGEIMGRLNVAYETAIKCLDGVDEVATSTHPAKNERIVRFKKGWQKGQGKIIPRAEVTYDINCQTTIRPVFRIAYDTIQVKRIRLTKKKRVPVYIESSGDMGLEKVDHVDYYLHPATFKRAILPVKHLSSDFGVILGIYGEFEVRGTVYLRDGSEYLLTPCYLNVFGGKERKDDSKFKLKGKINRAADL